MSYANGFYEKSDMIDALDARLTNTIIANHDSLMRLSQDKFKDLHENQINIAESILAVNHKLDKLEKFFENVTIWKLIKIYVFGKKNILKDMLW